MKLVERMKQALGFPSEAAPALEPEEKLEWPEGLPQQILTVEEAALDIYQRYGLPVEAGNYLRKGPQANWKRLPDDLTPEDKWRMLDEAPQGAGWKFVTRASIGRHSEVEEVRKASTLLMACESLRSRLEGKSPVSHTDIADALNLGTASGLLILARQQAEALAPSPDYQPLVFMAVGDEGEDGTDA